MACLAIRSLMLVALLPFPAAAQQGSEGQEGFTIRSDVRLVVLDVSVKDGKGNHVSGLTRENFKVFDEGRPQPIEIFTGVDVPVTVGIVVDESYSMTPKRVSVVEAAETFIKESNPRDEVFVLNFNDRVKRGLPEGTLFSDNLEQLSKALNRGIPLGRTALNDAVIDGLEQLKKGTLDKKTLVVISDGGDNASKHTRREMLDMVASSGATIYTIGLYDATDLDRDPGILRELAKLSGGEAFFPETPPDTIPICRRIAHDIRARYTVGFVPQAQPGSNALRHVKIQVEAPGRGKLTAIARHTYRYDEIPNQKK
jgi:Ca-activated chloride channel family protein